jgi:hypothetical protein
VIPKPRMIEIRTEMCSNGETASTLNSFSGDAVGAGGE